MSSSLIAFNPNQIKVIQGNVTFEGYEDLKHQADMLSEEIRKVEVTEENIKTSKKMLAAVNKRVKEIEDKRITIKKEMLEPYNKFESQVKDIVNTVKDADTFVRGQVRKLEEAEREKKKKEIESIFNKRIKHYSFSNIFSFNDFITPKHLNKSTSMKSVESEMVQWLEKIEGDLKAIEALPNSQDILAEYTETKDVTLAITIVNQREQNTRKLQEMTTKKTDKQDQFIITLEDSKDYQLVKMFMEQNNINYKSEKVVK